MPDRELRRSEAAPTPLTTRSGLDRLLGMMERWWKGWGLPRIAREYGISRQRVAAMLARVGCTRALWYRADHQRPDSRRWAASDRVVAARQALLHPLASRLTTRQRTALAWQAQGLALADIARRMVTTPQNVLHLQVAGRWRLERLSKPKRRRMTARGRYDESNPASPDEGVSVDWQGLLLPLTESDRPTTSGVTTVPPETATERNQVALVASSGAGPPFYCGRPRWCPRAKRSRRNPSVADPKFQGSDWIPRRP